MKINHLCLLAGALTFGLTAGIAAAAPRSGGNVGSDFLMGASDKSGWSCGIFYEGRDRHLEIGDNGPTRKVSTDIGAVYIGHTLVKWINVYAFAGMLYADNGTGPLRESDDNFLYGGAVHMDFFLHEIQDPVLMENEIRLSGDAAIYVSEFEVFGESRDFQEVKASLTAAIVNHLDGNKLFVPESIGIYGGPVYSQVFGGDLDDGPDDQVGLAAGLEVFHTKRVSYYAGIERFKDTGFTAGLNVRF